MFLALAGWYPQPGEGEVLIVWVSAPTAFQAESEETRFLEAGAVGQEGHPESQCHLISRCQAVPSMGGGSISLGLYQSKSPQDAPWVNV